MMSSWRKSEDWYDDCLCYYRLFSSLCYDVLEISEKAALIWRKRCILAGKDLKAHSFLLDSVRGFTLSTHGALLDGRMGEWMEDASNRRAVIMGMTSWWIHGAYCNCAYIVVKINFNYATFFWQLNIVKQFYCQWGRNEFFLCAKPIMSPLELMCDKHFEIN